VLAKRFRPLNGRFGRLRFACNDGRPQLKTLTTIGFDADDTLWQNEQFFRLTEERFAALSAEHAEA
jgi:hypothetical protein